MPYPTRNPGRGCPAHVPFRQCLDGSSGTKIPYGTNGEWVHWVPPSPAGDEWRGALCTTTTTGQAGLPTGRPPAYRLASMPIGPPTGPPPVSPSPILMKGAITTFL